MTAARPVKILFMIDKMTVGGAQRHLRQLLPALERRGFEAHLCCLDTLGDMAQGLEPSRLTALGVGKIHSRAGLRRFAPLVRRLRRERFDVVHTFLFSANIYGALAAAWAGVPVILTSRRDTQFGKRRRHWAALKFSNLLSDGVVVNSEELVGFISRKENLPQNRIFKIYNGIEPFDVTDEQRRAVRAALGIAPGAIVAGYLARFRPSKDHATFVRMAALLARTHPQMRFVAVGEGVTRAATESQVDRMGLRPFFLFTGERLDARTVAAAFDIAVFTSVAEGFPNALLEVMMLGRAVVATDVSGSNEGVRPGVNGYLCPCGDAAALAAKTALLADNPDLRAVMGRESLKIVLKDYSLDAMVDGYERLYRMLLAEKHIA